MFIKLRFVSTYLIPIIFYKNKWFYNRVGEGEACVNAGIGGVGGAGAARYRAHGGNCGAASLPRGAHHPPPDPKPPVHNHALVHHHPGECITTLFKCAECDEAM